MLLFRGVFRRGYGAHPPPGSAKYMLFWGEGGGVGLPPPKKKKCKPFLGKKNLNTPVLISLKLCLVLNHSYICQNSKVKTKRYISKIFIFGITNCAFLVLQIMHAGIIVLSEIIYCAVKWLKFTSKVLIYVNLYLS